MNSETPYLTGRHRSRLQQAFSDITEQLRQTLSNPRFIDVLADLFWLMDLPLAYRIRV